MYIVLLWVQVRFLADLVNAKVVASSSIMTLFDTFITVTYEPDIPRVSTYPDIPCVSTYPDIPRVSTYPNIPRVSTYMYPDIPHMSTKGPRLEEGGILYIHLKGSVYLFSALSLSCPDAIRLVCVHDPLSTALGESMYMLWTCLYIYIWHYI